MIFFSTFAKPSDATWNAVNSWISEWDAKIYLFGHECLPYRVEFSATVVTDIERTEQGTPLLSYMFNYVEENEPEETLFCFLNSDIVLVPRDRDAIALVLSTYEEFLLVGRRIDIVQEGKEKNPVLFVTLAMLTGIRLPPCGCDYFIYTRGLFPDIPDFAVGRCSFDNHLIYDALQRQKMVIDGSKAIWAIHQNHRERERKGIEYRRNFQLVKEKYPKWTAWDGWVDQCTVIL